MDSVPAMRNFVLDDSSSDEEGGISETASTVHLEECQDEVMEVCVEEIIEQLVMEISSIVPDITAAPTNEVDAAMDEVHFELNELGFVLFKVMRDDRSETSSICCLGEFPISQETLAAVGRPAEGARRGVKTPKLWPAYCESVAALAEEVADLRRACNELQTVTTGDNEGSLDRRRRELELDSRLSRAEREYIILEYTRIKEFPNGVDGSR